MILHAIKHRHIEFEGEYPTQMVKPNKIRFPFTETLIIGAKIANKGVIMLTKQGPNDFISNIFIRPKKDGTHRMILNLKPLNDSHYLYCFPAYSLSCIKLSSCRISKLHYRHLERDKISARENKGKFDSLMTLSVQSRTELTW